ncbi:MAG: hypothetical protein IKR73_04550 [Oscillospiraceae bacterium]|nr:hypothetical protein [Oscillospiraceae bacterium]
MNKASLLLGAVGVMLALMAVLGIFRFIMAVDIDANVTDVSREGDTDKWQVTVTMDLAGTEGVSTFTVKDPDSYPVGSTVSVRVDPMTRMVITIAEPITTGIAATVVILLAVGCKKLAGKKTIRKDI